jgi:hypothetical protein
MQANAAFSNERVVPQAFAKNGLSSQPYNAADASRSSMYVPTPDWMAGVKVQIEGFQLLQSGWDSYAGKQISMGMRSAAFHLILDLATLNTPRPSVVPVADGTIQFEWHAKGIDLEIRVLSMTKIEVAFEDSRDEEAPIEDEFEYDFRRLTSAMNVLSTR